MNIIKNAKKYLGKPYVWGGESMKEGGFDCSGYTYNVLNDSGIKVPRDTAQGYFNRFKSNSRNDEPGALLFFGKSTTSISHVAISCGNGYMYESIGSKRNNKNNPGKGVTLSKVSRRKDLIAIRLPYVKNVSRETIVIPTKTLRRGDMGVEVELLQKFLNLNNPRVNLDVDGKFGRLTYNAVKLFQKNNGLRQTGIYDTVMYNKFVELKRRVGL